MKEEVTSILGVRIHTLSIKEVLKIIEHWVQGDDQHLIVTPNPEIILKAQKDSELRDIINKADFSLPDGFGIILASCGKIKARITGTDLMMKMIEKNYRTNFISRSNGLSSRENIIHHLRNYDAKNPEILFIGLGCPDQEKWMQMHRKEYPSVKIFLTVGGGLDFLTGKQKRAPLFFQNIGLEWFWRLLHHPKRLPRIFNATIRFLWTVLKS